jgi:hypothetical protein
MFGKIEPTPYRCESSQCDKEHLAYIFDGLPHHRIQPQRLSTLVSLDGIEAVGHAGLTEPEKLNDTATASVDQRRRRRLADSGNTRSPQVQDLTDRVVIAVPEFATRYHFVDNLGWMFEESIPVDTSSDENASTPEAAVRTLLERFDTYEGPEAISTVPP